MEIYGLPACYYDENNIWHDFYAYIESQFPINDIKINTNELNIQNIQNVRIFFYSNNDIIWDQKDHLINTYKKPYINIFLLTFEDYDEYKKNIFVKLEEFIKNNHKISEWLVIYYPNVIIKNEANLKIFRKNLEKIQQDFQEYTINSANTKIIKFFEYIPEKKNDMTIKEDCVEEFRISLKISLENSINSRINEILSQIDAFYSLREKPGWDYLQFFAIKENLSLLFEMLSLYLESVQQYDELSNLFFESLKIKSNNFFNFKIEPIYENFEDFNPLLMNSSKQPYRFLIYNNKISEFLFLQYVFARKIYLLKKIDMDLEAMERLKHFFKEISVLFSQKHKFFSANHEESEFLFEIFKNIWFYQASNGFSQVFNANLLQSVNTRISIMTYCIGYLKNIAKHHLTVLGKLFFDFSDNFSELFNIEESVKILIKNVEIYKEKDVIVNEKEKIPNEKALNILNKLNCLHDKELLGSLKNSKGYYELLSRIYYETIKNYQLNGMKRLVFILQSENLVLNIRTNNLTSNEFTRKYSEWIKLDIKEWKDLDLIIKLNYANLFIINRNYDLLCKLLMELLSCTKLNKETKETIFKTFEWICSTQLTNKIEIISDKIILEDLNVHQKSESLIEINFNINNLFDFSEEINCKFVISFQEISDNSDQNQKKRKYSFCDVKLKPGKFTYSFDKEIKEKVYFKFFNFYLKFKKFKINNLCLEENIKNKEFFFQKKLKKAKIEIKDLITFENLQNFQIFCENSNSFFVVISDFSCIFNNFKCFLRVSDRILFPLFSIEKCFIVKNCLEISEISLEKSNFYNKTFENPLEDLKYMIFLINFKGESLSIEYSDKLSLKFEFYNKEELTCILKEKIEIDIIRIFDTKYTHYSNPLLSFSNIEIKNLSAFTFLINSFILNEKELNSNQKQLNPFETIGFVFPHQSIPINKGLFNVEIEYPIQKIKENHGKNEKNSIFYSIFKDFIEENLTKTLFYNLPQAFLSELMKSRKLNFIFQIEIETPNQFYIGIPEKIIFKIYRNNNENFEFYNRENLDYYFSLEKYSQNWIIIGNIQEKIKIFKENNCSIIEFMVIPMNVGYLELPKFQILSVKSDIMGYLSELKEEDSEKIEENENFYLKNTDLLINYIDGPNVLIKGFEKTKADGAQFI